MILLLCLVVYVEGFCSRLVIYTLLLYYNIFYPEPILKSKKLEHDNIREIITKIKTKYESDHGCLSRSSKQYFWVTTRNARLW